MQRVSLEIEGSFQVSKPEVLHTPRPQKPCFVAYTAQLIISFGA